MPFGVHLVRLSTYFNRYSKRAAQLPKVGELGLGRGEKEEKVRRT